MKKKIIKIANPVQLKNLKPLSKNQLETIIGGPETSRGTKTTVGD